MKISHLIKTLHCTCNETGVRHTNRKLIPAAFSVALLIIVVLGAPPAQAYYVSIAGDITAGKIFPESNDYQVFDTGQLQQQSVSHSGIATVDSIYGSTNTTYNAVAQLGLLSAFASGSAVTELSTLTFTEVDATASWNDTITITTGGTFTFSQTLTSQVSGGPCKSTDQWGIECGFTGTRLQTNIGGLPYLISLDEIDDGNQQQQTFTSSVQLTFMAGDQVDITQWINIDLLGWSVNGVSVSATIDALNTGIFTLDPVTLGASYTTQSGVSYISAVPIPPTVWLFGSGLLGLIGIARRKKAA